MSHKLVYVPSRVFAERLKHEKRHDSGWARPFGAPTVRRAGSRQPKYRSLSQSPVFDFIHAKLDKANVGDTATYIKPGRKEGGAKGKALHLEYQKQVGREGKIVYRLVRRYFQ